MALSVIRGSGLAGLAAVTAVVAHAGPEGLEHGGWLAAAVMGALPAGVALAFACSRLLGLMARTRSVRAGRLEAAHVRAHHPLPVTAVAGCLLLCQAAAHLAMLAAGAHPAQGPAGSPALHMVLALAAALGFAHLERAVARTASALADAIRRVLELLARSSRRQSPGPIRLRSARGHLPARGRAPPLPAPS